MKSRRSLIDENMKARVSGGAIDEVIWRVRLFLLGRALLFRNSSLASPPIVGDLVSTVLLDLSIGGTP